MPPSLLRWKLVSVSFNMFGRTFWWGFKGFLSFAGHHVINIDVDGNPIKGSPFTCNVYNVDKIKVTGLGTAKVRISELNV